MDEDYQITDKVLQREKIRPIQDVDSDGMKTFCPECGPGVPVDEDGCCMSCGATAIGAAVDEIMKYWDYCKGFDMDFSSPDQQTITLQWYCGRAIGNPYWQRQGDWVFDCDECCTEFETTHTQDEIDEEISVTCPDCGAELTMFDDCPERK
jgi:hypothetical protein